MIIDKYTDTMVRFVKLYCNAPDDQIRSAVNYSIKKRYKSDPVTINNSYTHHSQEMTLLQLTDWIMSKQPIVTAYGTIFRRHADSVNPMAVVIQQFLDTRKAYKKKMFTYPKGTEDFEHYNLLQQLSKIDVNGLYGTIGQHTALIYNINVATSVTNQGRASISHLTMFMESFLSNNVKFGSLNEVLSFIDHVTLEKSKRQYKDEQLLDKPITIENCFAKLIFSCGYRWIPDNDEMEIIWRVVSNLGQEDLNRVYYKNNLYEFMENESMKKALRTIVESFDWPYLNPAKPPENVKPMLDELTSILKEYVYYGYPIIDRIDRCNNMIKDICLISDTDSAIISVDGWYRFCLKVVKGANIKFSKWVPKPGLFFLEQDEFGDITNKELLNGIIEYDPDYDIDFEDDKLIELKHTVNPLLQYPEDNLRYTLINIICYILDKLINDYMEIMTRNNQSYDPATHKCRMQAKTEFLFRRVLLTQVKKNYASIQEVQEGNPVPKNAQLDIKGIASMAKSSMAKSTRDALKQILLEDILNAPTIDQFKVIKDIAILEHRITDSVFSGSKEFYKPETIKSIDTYKFPFRIDGVKAAYAWNKLKPKDDNLPYFNLNERNALVIAKVDLNVKNVDNLKDKFPKVYENAKKLFEEDGALDKSDQKFRGQISAIAIPEDVKVPKWVLEIIDYREIVNNNIAGFPLESINIRRLNRNSINYTNIIKL